MRAGDVVVAKRLCHILVYATTVSTEYRMIVVQNIGRETYNHQQITTINYNYTIQRWTWVFFCDPRPM